MYQGHGYGLDSNIGPASWFIICKKNNYNITKWKEKCDLFWKKNHSTLDYFWMDGIFKDLLESDKFFKRNFGIGGRKKGRFKDFARVLVSFS